MRQILVTKIGSPDVLRLVDGPMPDPQPGEVRIKVGAAGVNFADVVGRLGVDTNAPKPPYVPGYEVAGTVDALGAGVDSALLGQDVIGLTHFGGYSEYVCVPTDQVFPRPVTWTLEQGAGFPVVFLTAYGALVALAGIKPGDHVLIQAAAGGVGLAAVEICNIFGATIYGTASSSKHEFLRARGVQYPIDYRKLDFEREIKRLTNGRGVQIALDTVGGRSWLKSYRALSAAGRLVICGAFVITPSQRRAPLALLKMALTTPWLRFNPVSLSSDNKGVSGMNLGRMWGEKALLRTWADQLLVWQQEGKLDIHVDCTFRFDEVAAAHRYLQERRNIGKVILIP
jgi:NADPH:quinone reductase-like Zn-dependent oxidoreductase